MTGQISGANLLAMRSLATQTRDSAATTLGNMEALVSHYVALQTENIKLRADHQYMVEANRIRKSKYGVGTSLSPDGKFAARITIPGTKERLYLGRFDTAAEAVAAYQGASTVVHGKFSVFAARGGRGVVSPLDR